MCPSEQSLPSSERKVISTRRVRADVNLTLDILLSNVQTVACPTHGTNKSLNVSDTDGTVRRSVGQQTDRQFTVTSPLQMAPTDVSHWMAPSDILSVKKQPTDSRPPPLDVSAPSTSTGSRSQLTITSPSLPVSLSLKRRRSERYDHLFRLMASNTLSRIDFIKESLTHNRFEAVNILLLQYA